MTKYPIGVIAIVPTGENPYTHSISGELRRKVIDQLRRGTKISTDISIWIAPTQGGAFEVKQSEVDKMGSAFIYLK
jgi:hypothetical protein